MRNNIFKIDYQTKTLKRARISSDIVNNNFLIKLSENQILNKINIKTVEYVNDILSETLEDKIEPLIDIKPEIGQKIKNDQIEPTAQTH